MAEGGDLGHVMAAVVACAGEFIPGMCQFGVESGVESGVEVIR